MRGSLLIVTAVTLLAAAPAALASDGGHAKIDPKALQGYANGGSGNGGLVPCPASGCVADAGLNDLASQAQMQAMQAQQDLDQQQAQSIQAQLQAEQAQQQQERQQIQTDLQTQIMKDTQDTVRARPRTSDELNGKWDQIIQGYDGAGGDVAYDGGTDGAGGDGDGTGG